MKQFCENPLCQNMAVKEVPISVDAPSDGVRSLCATCEEPYIWGYQHGKLSVKGLTIEPPPRDKGPEPMYRVVYVIDLNAADPKRAAESVHEIMADPDSMAPFLHVLDSRGHDVTVDLLEEVQDGKTMPQLNESYQQARRFVVASATMCPKCSSQNISFASVDIEGQSAYQQASCQDCEADFYVIYRLVGFGIGTKDATEVHTIAEDFGEITEGCSPC